MTPDALTREDVVGVCLDFYGDLSTVEQRNAIVQLRDTDAALRATITQQAQELEGIDDILARRPALADCVTRRDKIETAINVAKRIDDLKQQLSAFHPTRDAERGLNDPA